MKDNLSTRGRGLVKDMSPLMHADFSTRSDLYHPETNPGGHINMGTAETHLVNAEALGLLRTLMQRMELRPPHIHYDYFHGSGEFRTAIAEYWQGVIFGQDSDRRLTADNVVVGAGCSLALEMLATVLGDPGDVFLIPAPYYSGFVDDIHHRAGVIPVGVHCGPDLEREPFEAALAAQQKQGRRVKAVLFSSPHNPVGTVYAKEAVEGLIAFCIDHNLDIISDEIYAQTIHDPATTWHSTLKLVPGHYLHRVHVTSSFAKDFALSGLRTGFVLSFHADLLKAIQGLAYYSAVSTHTQALLTQLLRAPELPALLTRNRQQLRTACRLMADKLRDMGIPTLPAQGGIFLFADFADHLAEPTFPAEFALWRKFHGEHRVNISPGQLFDAARPGWFRICYAQDPATITEACRRLRLGL